MSRTGTESSWPRKGVDDATARRGRTGWLLVSLCLSRAFDYEVCVCVRVCCWSSSIWYLFRLQPTDWLSTPANTSITACLARPSRPFVQESSQLVSEVGLSCSSLPTTIQLLSNHIREIMAQLSPLVFNVYIALDIYFSISGTLFHHLRDRCPASFRWAAAPTTPTSRIY